jgi:hypothetical protein
MNMFDANKTHTFPLGVSDVSCPSQLTNVIFFDFTQSLGSAKIKGNN